jgi:hypothetical protein
VTPREILGSFYLNDVALVTAVLFFPRLQKGSSVTLLVDTGSSNTLIHPATASEILGLDFEQSFKERQPEPMRGIGGPAEFWPELADVTFPYEGGQETGRRQAHKEGEGKGNGITIPGQSVRIAVPTAHNNDYFSLLGRDLIHKFELLYSFPTLRLRLTQL